MKKFRIVIAIHPKNGLESAATKTVNVEVPNDADKRQFLARLVDDTINYSRLLRGEL